MPLEFNDSLTRAGLLKFLRTHRWAVQASVTPAGAPQAAVVGFIVNEELEIGFDTATISRKHENFRNDSRIALVIGWDQGQTVQYEGLADEPFGEELRLLKQAYFERFPDGLERESWPDITYLRVKPTWVRFSDFTTTPPLIVEIEERLRDVGA